MKMIIFAVWLILHEQYQQSQPPKPMAKLVVKDTTIRTLAKNGIDYICITDIARQKNPDEPKDVVKNWMRVKNTLEYLGLWESLNNPDLMGSNSTPF